MSFRNRPVLDRKHRPRWQDELRTQRLMVGAFAGAIAVAIGIFGATAWSEHYSAHLKQVAVVDGASINVDEQGTRVNIIGSELQAAAVNLQGELGGMQDSIINQQLSFIQNELQGVVGTATDSLVTASIIETEASSRGITVSSAEIDAEKARRQTLVAREKLSLITVSALPDGAAAGAKPTDADWARALADATAIYKDLKGGADFAATAKAKSKDPSAASGGLLGWVQAGDAGYKDYFAEAKNAAVGSLLGPTKDTSGYHILRLDDQKAAGPHKFLIDLLAASGVTDGQYRAYLRTELLRNKVEDYFKTTVLTNYQPQREVAQIYITKDTGGTPTPKQRVRHFLAAPIPGGQDQSQATPAQWAAALARAQAFRVAALKPGADWATLAATSDDPGSRSQGGDLGWFDPTSTTFVAEFTKAVNALTVGQISQPVKTQFGYHIIQVTDLRASAQGEATDLLAQLKKDPSKFTELAKKDSEDSVTSASGGDLGWVIPYQLEEPRNSAVFALTKPNQISDLVTSSSGYYIFKLTDSSDLRFVPQSQLDTVRGTGFTRWLDAIRAKRQVWIDPAYAPATTTG